MIEVVFFDVGETLLRPYPSFAELFARVCRERGHPVSAAAVGQIQNSLAPHLLDFAEDAGVEKGPSLSPEDSRTFWTYLYRRFLAELGIDDPATVVALYDTFSDVSSYRLFDEVPSLLNDLRSAYRLGIISNFDEWLQEMLVELQIGPHFDVIVISGVEGLEKPDPKIYELALARAEVAPERSVHVGDSPSADVAPALAAGMHAILLDRDGRYRHRTDVPVIESLKDLPRVISKF